MVMECSALHGLIGECYTETVTVRVVGVSCLSVPRRCQAFSPCNIQRKRQIPGTVNEGKSTTKPTNDYDHFHERVLMTITMLWLHPFTLL